MYEKAYVEILVSAVRHDISKGMKRDEVLRALANVMSNDIVMKVKELV